ncbi:MAG: nucleoside monophosphate kinase [bacterium]
MSRQIYLFFGPPGSGKGTQSDMLGAKLGLPVVSAGELLRTVQNSGSRLGRQLGPIINQGKLVPASIIFQLIKKRSQKPDTRQGFILDGYPRHPQQLAYLKKILEKTDQLLAIVINVSDQEVKQRIGGRRICDCGAAYHLQYNPPKKKGLCNICGKKIYVRSDDTPQVISNRLRDYRASHKLILQFFAQQGKLIQINGEQTIKQVLAEMLKKIKQH